MSTHLGGVRHDERLFDDPETEKPEPKRPPLWRVHGALILGQCIFGGGSIVGKLGVARFNPMVFALIREVAAGILLMMFALYQDGRVRLHRRDALIFFGCGVFIFTNQAAFIVGDKLAGAVLASAWQPRARKPKCVASSSSKRLSLRVLPQMRTAVRLLQPPIRRTPPR